MTVLLASGIDNMDVTTIEQANSEMELGGQCIMEAAALLGEFSASR